MAAGEKAAFVAVVGRPSAGKSSLVNLICGQKLAIVSPVPQTTRNVIRGILTRSEGQLVFMDTPGRHTSERKMNKKLTEVSEKVLYDTELVLYVLDASRAPGPEEEAIAARLLPLAERVIAVINKTDLPASDPERAMGFLHDHMPGLDPSRCFRISCYQKQGIEAVLECLFEMAPEGDPMYSGDIYTDQEIPFRIAEIIREKAINRLREELPHSIYVQVADTELKENDSGEQRLWVRAFIITERESQKGMVVGAGGAMIKAIRQASQKELNQIFEWKVDLDLRVKTAKDWRHSDAVLRRIIN